MTTAAKRAKKKANRAAKRAAEYAEARIADGELERDPEAVIVTESEHAAALMALAKAKRMQKKVKDG